MMGDDWPSRRVFPNRTVDGGDDVRLGGLALSVRELGPGESHMDSLWQLDPTTIFAGDVAYNGMHAYLADGRWREWLATLDRLEAELPDDVTLYVGHGPPGGKDLLAGQRRYIETLWVPIEKLFMTDIGFDNGSVAVMAAAYAAVVPLLEVPSGILADRWSRRGVVLLAQAALIVSVVIGGLSPNVGMYIVAALFLGVFFAMQSGTFESIAYDTVLEETGDSTMFERTIGRIRFVGERGPRRERPRRRAAGRGGAAARDLLHHGPVHRGRRVSPCCASGNRGCTGPRKPSRCASRSPPPTGPCSNGARCARSSPCWC